MDLLNKREEKIILVDYIHTHTPTFTNVICTCVSFYNTNRYI